MASTSDLVGIQKRIIRNRLEEAKELILFASNILKEIPRDVGMVNGISIGASTWAHDAMTLAQTIEQGSKEFFRLNIEVTQSVNEELQKKVLEDK